MFIWKRCLALAVPVAACVQPLRPMVVIGNSMAPTYASGSFLLTRPVDRPLRRGDVVVVNTDSGPIVKRIALLPGDRRYQWKNATGWVDLVGLTVPLRHEHGSRLRSIPVPVGTVYLLGDNIKVSDDSRDFGPVDAERVVRLVVDQRTPGSYSVAERRVVDEWLTLGISRKGRRA